MQSSKTEMVENSNVTKRDFNLPLAILKLIIVAVAVGAILYTAKATFTDTVLENLEKNYISSMSSHDKNLELLKSVLLAEKSSADTACSAFKSLKAYKESKKMPLKNDSNPCVTVKAPQEGF